MRINDFITEMPIASFEPVGDLGTGRDQKGFNVGDWKVSHSDKAIAKIFRIFEKTPFVFNFIVMFKKGDQGLMFDRNMTAEKLSELVGKPVITDGRITVVQNNHITAMSNRMPISAWTLAHRFGHAAHLNTEVDGARSEIDHPVAKVWYQGDRDLKVMLKPTYELYKKDTTASAAVVCTFKSARDDNINSQWEVIADFFAQYLISGRIRLKRSSEINPVLIRDADALDDYLDGLEDNLNTTMENVLQGLVGKIVGF